MSTGIAPGVSNTKATARDKVIQRRIERMIDDYHTKFLTPSEGTIRRWKREIVRELDNKNQLPLPLVIEE